MRHCVFLAVLLSLVLSLSKASSATTGETPTAPDDLANPKNNGSSETTSATTAKPPESSNATTNASSATTGETPTAPDDLANPKNNGSSETTNATTAKPPESSNATTNGSSETTNATTATPPGSSNGTTNGSSETTNATTATPPGSSNGTTNGSSETTNATTATPPGSSNGTTNGSSETTNATTATPPTTTTPSNSSSETTNATTATPPGTTTPSNSSSETTNATTATPPTTTTPSNMDFCKNDPCGTSLAKCVSLNSNYTCVCQYGFYYDNRDCHRGKIFPGVIRLKYNLSNSVQNVNSTEYEELLQNVTQFFKAAFMDLKGYKETVIVEIQPAKEVRNYSPMTITVTNLFEENSDVNDTVVASAIAITANSSSFVSSYEVTTYCAAFKCDERTTICEESEFPKCKCKDDFTMTEWDERSCSGCRKDCSAEENKYCAQEKGVPTCKCLTNFANITGKCVSCPVGYSGENCNNNSELILIIVGTVFGAIILALVTAVAIISVRSKHKPDPEKKSLIRSGHANPNPSGERQSTMFPRVQTTSGHTNPGYQPNNPYGAPSSNRGPFPARDYEDLYEISREPEGFRMQRRY